MIEGLLIAAIVLLVVSIWIAWVAYSTITNVRDIYVWEIQSKLRDIHGLFVKKEYVSREDAYEMLGTFHTSESIVTNEINPELEEAIGRRHANS